MSATYINPEIHHVRETPQAEFFRRHLHCPEMMTFWNADTQQLVLGHWLNRTTGLVEELEDLGPSGELLTPDLVCLITRCWGTVDFKKVKKSLNAAHRQRQEQQDTDLIEMQDRFSWGEKKMRSTLKGPVPYLFGGGPSAGNRFY